MPNYLSRESGEVGKSERKTQGSRIQGVKGPSEITKGFNSTTRRGVKESKQASRLVDAFARKLANKLTS
jgi:hypothetical protein